MEIHEVLTERISLVKDRDEIMKLKRDTMIHGFQSVIKILYDSRDNITIDKYEGSGDWWDSDNRTTIHFNEVEMK